MAHNVSVRRKTKKIDEAEHIYTYAGGRLLRETYGNHVLDFAYDTNGSPYTLTYDGTKYYYIANVQGDVMRLINTSGNTAATYSYDPFGKVLSASGSMAEINPIRYRGYYYDIETGFYYLQSRYYDPVVKRFLNADVFTSTEQGFLGYNMFSYCLNDPVNREDSNGKWSGWATAGLIVGAALCVAAVTVLTCGVGTATLAGAVAVGAAKGALVGAAVGTIAGAGV